MHIEQWPIERVQPFPGNPRKITEAAIDNVAQSLAAFGWRQPLVVDADSVLIVGHVRYLAARKLAMTDVPVHVADNLTPEQIAAYRLADNRVGEDSSWHEGLLTQALQDLTGDMQQVTGFSSDELNRLVGTLIDNTEQSHQELDTVVADVSCEADPDSTDDDGKELGATTNDFTYQEQFGVMVICESERHQQQVYESLQADGHNCRVVVV